MLFGRGDGKMEDMLQAGSVIKQLGKVYFYGKICEKNDEGNLYPDHRATPAESKTGKMHTAHKPDIDCGGLFCVSVTPSLALSEKTKRSGSGTYRTV